jgi:hypothetical protein
MNTEFTARFEKFSAISPLSSASNRYFHDSNGRLSRSLNSIMPPAPSTNSPCVSNKLRLLSAPGSDASERSIVTCRSDASTLICGPIVTAAVR